MLDGDSFRERQPESIDHAALSLGDDVVGLHRYSLIDRHPEIGHPNLSGSAFHRDLGYPSDACSGIIDIGQAKAAIVTLAVPVCHCGHGLDHFASPRRVLEQLEPPCQGVDAPLVRDLVDEHPRRKFIGDESDPAQRDDSDPGIDRKMFSQPIGNRVARNIGPGD